MGIFWLLLILIIVVALHEAGHAYAALRCGVGIEQFSIGFGPILKTWNTKKFPIHFRLFFILGGYVKPKSKNCANHENLDGNFIEDAGWLQKIFIFSAGILANILTAIIARTLMFWFAPPDTIFEFGYLKIGFAECPGPYYLAPLYAIKSALVLFWKWISLFILLIQALTVYLITFFQGIFNPAVEIASMQDSGVIGMFKNMQQFFVSANTTPIEWQLIGFFYYFSIIIAAFNLLPFPPLDGGHIANILIQKIFGANVITKIISWILFAIGIGIMGLICLTIIMSDLSFIWHFFMR